MNRNILIFAVLLFFTSVDLSGQHFHVEGSKLLDPNGNEFVIRGVNNPHAWNYSRALSAVETISDLKANSIRVVWETNKSAGKLEKIIKECIKHKIIPIIELHDVTGDTTSEGLMRMVAYYTDEKVKNVLLKYEKNLLINIANAWGNTTTTDAYWKESYTKAISEIRNAGIKTTLVIDAPGTGQNINPILVYGKDLLQYDPEHNLLFSIHMFGFWNEATLISTKLQEAYDSEVPLLVGSFAFEFDKGKNNLKCKVDHQTIMEKCNELNYGYLAWSWTGNDKVNAWLDLSDKSNRGALTWWGRQVFTSKIGITRTAKLASVYPKETPKEQADREKREAKESKKRKKAAAEAKKERLKKEKKEQEAKLKAEEKKVKSEKKETPAEVDNK